MTCHEAREKVRAHLDRVGHKPVVLTEKIIRRWWNVLNVAVFYGKLPQPQRIKLHSARDHHAQVVCKNEHEAVWELEMAPEYVSRWLFLDVLVHEMVHAWEHMRHRVMGHGKRFVLWRKRIKRTVMLDLMKEISEADYVEES